MLDLGFTELSMEPVVTSPGDPSELTQEDLPIVLEQYEKLAELMIKRRREGKPFTFPEIAGLNRLCNLTDDCLCVGNRLSCNFFFHINSYCLLLI